MNFRKHSVRIHMRVSLRSLASVTFFGNVSLKISATITYCGRNNEYADSVTFSQCGRRLL
jgi:hypothetical protein